jgi:predicted RecB family endonuclease
MVSRIVKGLTVAAGMGLAIGIGSGNRRTEENRMGTKLPDDGPEAGPIAARLDRIEARISAIEERSPISAGSDIDALHAQVTEHRKKVAAQVAAVEKRFETLAREIPAVLESIVVPRIDDLRRVLRTEIQQSVGATLAKFERTVNNKLAERIATVEKAVREQSVTVNALSGRAVESDANVQRLVAAVERLCAGGTFDPSALREPSLVEQLALKAQANPGRRRKADAPVQPIEFESGFRHQIIAEEETEPPKHHRRPMARL